MLKVTIINTFDKTGGAAIAANRLTESLNLNEGVNASMVVQEKKGNATFSFLYQSGKWAQLKSKIRFILEVLTFTFYEKSKKIRYSFSNSFFGTNILKNKKVQDAAIIHLHWINFGYLSLKSIKKIIESDKVLIVTLHDMWFFTGGCHYAGNCQNYMQSCGNCTTFLKRPKSKDLSNRRWKAKFDLLENADITIVTCSEWLGERAKESSLLKNKTVYSIPNPINHHVFKPLEKTKLRTELGLDPEKKYILFGAVNVLDLRKGFSYFIEAIKLLENTTDYEIIVFGKAKEEDFKDIPLKVNFFGSLSDVNQIVKCYAASDVFVISSLEENLPNSIMEAMSCGVSVVGFNVGGIPEMIDHQTNGYVAKLRSASDLSVGINWVLKNNDGNHLGMNARAKVENNYTNEIVSKKYISLYNDLLKKGLK